MNPKNMMAEKAAQTIIDNTDALDHLTRIIASLETDLLDEVAALQDALDVEHIETVPDADKRADSLKSLAASRIRGDMGGFYVGELLDHLDNPERAESYLGIEQDEWQSQIETWAQSYREQGISDYSDRELADHHIRDIWGVTIDQFEEQVVNWNESQVMRRVLAGNLQTAREGIARCREEVTDA